MASKIIDIVMNMKTKVSGNMSEEISKSAKEMESVNLLMDGYSDKAKQQVLNLRALYKTQDLLTKLGGDEVKLAENRLETSKALLAVYDQISKEQDAGLDTNEDFVSASEDLLKLQEERLANAKKLRELEDRQEEGKEYREQLAVDTKRYQTAERLVREFERLKEIKKTDNGLSKDQLKTYNAIKPVYDKIKKSIKDSIGPKDEIVKLTDREQQIAEEVLQTRKDIDKIASETIGRRDEVMGISISKSGAADLVKLQKELETALRRTTQALKDLEDAQEGKISSDKREKKTMAEKITQAGVFMIVMRQLQNAYRFVIRTVTELDEALTEVAVVTTMNREETQALIPAYQKLAKQVGLSTTEVAKLSIEFFRQGRSAQEVMRLTELAAKSAKVAGIDAIEAANFLTSAVNGFQLSMSEAEKVADRMAALGARSASSFEELATALSKVAPAAKVAGVDIDTMLGYLAKGIETTREAPENIGTAFKTIFARMRELKDFGKTMEDNMSINRVEEALDSIGVQLRDSQGEFRSLQDVINEVGMQWDLLTKNQQAYIATTLAGTRQQARLIALFEDFDRTIELVNISQDSAGALNAQFQETLLGMEAAVNRVRVSMQSLVTAFVNTDAIVTFINFFADVIEVIARGVEALAENSGASVIGIAALVTVVVLLTKKMKLLNKEIAKTVALSLPFSGTALLIAGITAAIVALIGYIAKMGNEYEVAADKAAKFSQTMDEIRGRITEIETKEKTLDSLINEYDELRSKIFLTVEEIDRLRELQETLMNFEGYNLIGDLGEIDEINLEKIRSRFKEEMMQLNADAKKEADKFLKTNENYMTKLEELYDEGLDVEHFKKSLAFALSEGDVQYYHYILSNLEEIFKRRDEIFDKYGTDKSGEIVVKKKDMEESLAEVREYFESIGLIMEDYMSYYKKDFVHYARVDMGAAMEDLEKMRFDEIESFFEGLDVTDPQAVIKKFMGDKGDWNAYSQEFQNYFRGMLPEMALQFDKIGIEATSGLRNLNLGEAVLSDLTEDFNEWGPEMSEQIITLLSEFVKDVNAEADTIEPLDLADILLGKGADSDSMKAIGDEMTKMFTEITKRAEEAGIPITYIQRTMSNIKYESTVTAAEYGNQIDLLVEQRHQVDDLYNKWLLNTETRTEYNRLQELSVELGYQDVEALHHAIQAAGGLNNLFENKLSMKQADIEYAIKSLEAEKELTKQSLETAKAELAKLKILEGATKQQKIYRLVYEGMDYGSAYKEASKGSQAMQDQLNEIIRLENQLKNIDTSIANLGGLIDWINKKGSTIFDPPGKPSVPDKVNETADAFDRLKHSLESLGDLDLLRSQLDNVTSLLGLEGISESFKNRLEQEKKYLEKSLKDSLLRQKDALEKAAKDTGALLLESGIVGIDEFGKAYVKNYSAFEKMNKDQRDLLDQSINDYNDYASQIKDIVGELIDIRKEETAAINKEYEERKAAATAAIDDQINELRKALADARAQQDFDLKAQELSDSIAMLDQNIALLRRDTTSGAQARLADLEAQRAQLALEQKRMAEDRAQEALIAKLEADKKRIEEMLEAERMAALDALNGSMIDMVDVLRQLNYTIEDVFTDFKVDGNSIIESGEGIGQFSVNAAEGSGDMTPVYLVNIGDRTIDSRNPKQFGSFLEDLILDLEIGGVTL